MSHKPKTEAEKKFKATLTEVIKTGIEDFYRHAMDPSFADKEKTKIHYMAGEKPAVGKSYNWWKETAKDSRWCFGTKAQYVAFLGVLIKMLVSNKILAENEEKGFFWGWLVVSLATMVIAVR